MQEQEHEHEHEHCLAFFFGTDVLPELQSIFVLARKATHKHSNSRIFSRDDHLPTDLPFPGLLGTCLVDKFFRVLVVFPTVGALSTGGLSVAHHGWQWASLSWPQVGQLG